MWYELRTSLVPGLGYGLLISIFTMGFGLVMSQASIWMILIWTLVFGLAAQYRYLSAAYTFGITIIAALLSTKMPISLLQIGEGESETIVSLAILLGLMLVVEGLLISKNAVRYSTPKMQKGKRGLPFGLHESKRLWLVPIFILVPGDAVTQIVPWWPVISVGAQSYAVFLVPFLIGFMRTIKSYEPTEALVFTGRRVLALAALVLVLGILSYWWSVFAIIAMGVAMLGRFTISMQERIADETRPAYFTVRKDGLIVLGVIPGTVGAEMELKPGEVIVKVNGVTPTSIEEFYHALQFKTTGAFCKLEVIDIKGEPRFVQHALFAGEHHELGIVFAMQAQKWDTEAARSES